MKEARILKGWFKYTTVTKKTVSRSIELVCPKNGNQQFQSVVDIRILGHRPTPKNHLGTVELNILAGSYYYLSQQ
jgi:hypothetical protein